MRLTGHDAVVLLNAVEDLEQLLLQMPISAEQRLTVRNILARLRSLEGDRKQLDQVRISGTQR